MSVLMSVRHSPQHVVSHTSAPNTNRDALLMCHGWVCCYGVLRPRLERDTYAYCLPAVYSRNTPHDKD